MSLHALAQDMSSKGRHGDSMLVHMAPSEVAGLHALALSHGKDLTINPDTGLPEAFSLKSLLPTLLGIALAPATGGASLGLTSMWQTAALVGGAYGLAKGSLKEGLLAGLGAYGGAGLASSLGAAGVSEAAAQEAFKSQAAEQAAANATATGTAAGTSATEAMLGAPTTTTASTTGAAGAAGAAGTSAAESALMGYEPVATATALPGAPVDPGMLSTAGYTPAPPPTGLEALQQGAQSIYDKGTFGDFAKANKSNLYAIGASAAMAPEDEEGMPETKRDPGYIRPARYDWRTGKYEYYEPVKASEWGTRNLSEYTNPNDPNARTPIGRKAGGLMALANGGAIAFADGGMTPQQYESINAFLATNPSAEALAAAQAQYGVSDTDLTRAREYANVGAPPGTPGVSTGNVVVGGGGYSPFEMPGGTKEEGYTRDYSPEERLAINQAWIDNQNDPAKVMDLMTQYGVSAKDLALSRGIDQNTINQYLVRGGATPDFGGINAGWDDAKQREFIAQQGKQPNPLGQGTIADMWAKQGITDPLNNPLLKAQAQEQLERDARRNQMRTAAGATPAPGPTTPGPTTPGPTTPGPTTPGPTTPGPTTPGPTTPPPVYTPPTGPYNPRPPMPNTPTIDASTTGGSRDAYKYLFGKGAYPTNPYLPIDPATGKPVAVAKSIYDTPGYEALRPKTPTSLYSTDKNKKPTGNPGTGNEWVWETDKWVAKPIGSSTPTPTPSTVVTPTDTAKNGGLMPRRMALGGLGALAGGGAASQYNLGGYSDGGRLLRGPGDGVSDSIPATIGNRQPARLADGEFVVPARIVSELGNGSTEAGARKLYAMMDRVQKARGKTTGKNRIAANSRAEKHLPA